MRITSSNNFFWSNNRGVWFNNDLLWENSSLEYDDEPLFEIIDDNRIIIIDLFGKLYILNVSEKKIFHTISTHLEQINGIVYCNDKVLVSGLKKNHEAIYKGFAHIYSDVKVLNELGIYKLSGKYNTPLYLNTKDNYFLYSATGFNSPINGKIYKYDYKLNKETVIINDFAIYDYFYFCKKTNRIIISQDNKISLFDIKEGTIVLKSYFYIEDFHPVVISVKELNGVFYIMLSDKIYLYDFYTKKTKTIKEFDILMEPIIEDGDISPEYGMYVYIDEEKKLTYESFKA